jgi:hypothetical protein
MTGSAIFFQSKSTAKELVSQSDIPLHLQEEKATSYKKGSYQINRKPLASFTIAAT